MFVSNHNTSDKIILRMLIFFLQTELFEGAVMEVDAGVSKSTDDLRKTSLLLFSLKEEAAKFANVLNKKYHKI